MSVDQLVIRRPDDWHLHLRDGDMMAAVLPATAKQFARAVVMPNLAPPVVSVREAAAYRNRIKRTPRGGTRFTPLMTLYLTDESAPEEVEKGFQGGVVFACKLYPRDATTNSELGVTDMARIAPVLARMEKIDMPLLVHGEVTDPEVDVFDREAVFLDRVLAPMMEDFPQLRVVLEHITTTEAVDFIRDGSDRLAATITPHHLMIDRNLMLGSGIVPDLFCLPIVKRARHREALQDIAASGHPRFFLGTDSAPHAIADKHQMCGCAGIFNAPVAMEAYATVFDELGALDRLEDFAAHFGAQFYGLPVNEETLILERDPWTVPEVIQVPGAGPEGCVRPFLAGETINWRVTGVGPTTKGPVL